MKKHTTNTDREAWPEGKLNLSGPKAILPGGPGRLRRQMLLRTATTTMSRSSPSSRLNCIWCSDSRLKSQVKTRVPASHTMPLHDHSSIRPCVFRVAKCCCRSRTWTHLLVRRTSVRRAYSSSGDGLRFSLYNWKGNNCQLLIANRCFFLLAHCRKDFGNIYHYRWIYYGQLLKRPIDVVKDKVRYVPTLRTENEPSLSIRKY